MTNPFYNEITAQHLSLPFINSLSEHSQVYYNWITSDSSYKSLIQFKATHNYYKNIGWVFFPDEGAKMMFVLRHS